MKKNLEAMSDILLAIVYMLFIISFSTIMVLNFKPLYYADIDHLKIEENSDLSKSEIKENYNALVEYNSMFNYEELEFPSLNMSENGKIHFSEVKNIFIFLQYLCIISFFLALLGSSWKLNLKQNKYLKYTGIFTLLIPMIFGALIAANWQIFFVTFHRIFFRNDYWIFDPALDPVINILPDTFFMHCAIMILCIVLVGVILSFISYHYLNKRWTKE